MQMAGKSDVTYDGNNQYAKEVTEGESFGFEVAAKEWYQVEQVTDQNGTAIQPASVNGNVSTYNVTDIQSERVLSILYKEASQSDAQSGEEKAEEETTEANDENEQQESDIVIDTSKPECTLSQTVDGTTVTVTAPEGTLEAGWTLSVKKVSAKSVKNAIENAIENAEFIEEIKAFDITIFDKDGNEIQPDGSVQVTFSGTGVKGDATEVYHVDDAKKKAEKVSDASTDKDVAFAADHFSIYAVVGMTSTDEDIDLAKEVTMGDSFTLSADYKRNSEWTVATSSPNGVLELGKTTEEWGWGSRVSKVSITAKKQGTAIVSYGDIRIRVTVVKKQISVQFDKNGGSESAPSSINTEQGESIILPEYTGTKKDYVFAGWSTDKDATSGGSAHYTVPVYQPGDSYLAGDKNVTLYAVWASKDVNATFYIRLDNTIPTEPQGHAAASYTNGITVNGAIKTASFYANTTYPGVLDQLNSVPTDRQIAAKCSEKGITYNPETQYVHWYVIKHESAWHVDGVLLNKRDYVLSYNANCRAGEWKNMPDGASYKEGTTATVSGTVPTREGYVFTGWNTAANGSGTSYKAKDQITMNSNVTLYAQWTEKDKVTLRYVVDPAAGGSLTNAIESINPETGVPAGSAVTVNEG